MKTNISKASIQIIWLWVLIFACVSAPNTHTDVAQPKGPAVDTDVLSGNRICKNQGISGELFRRTELFLAHQDRTDQW